MVLKIILYILIGFAILFGLYKIFIADEKGVGSVSFIFAVLTFFVALIPGNKDKDFVENTQQVISSDVERGVNEENDEKDRENENKDSEDAFESNQVKSDEEVGVDKSETDIQRIRNEDSVLQEKEIEINDTVENANLIEVNKKYQGNLSTDSDVDYYKFVIESDGKVSISFEHPKMDNKDRLWEVYLIDNEKNDGLIKLYSIGASTNDESNAARIRAGEYYIKVNSYYYSDKDYFFTVNFIEESDQFEKEENNTIDMANSINVNANYTGNLQTDNDVDYYRFSVNEKGKINFSFEHEKIDNRDRFWEIYLLDGINDNTILTLYSRGSEASLQSDYARIPSGDYYLKIKSYYYSNRDYNFIVNFESESEQYESEWNNDFSSANNIVLGSKYYGNMQTDNDIDYYCFTVSEQRNITVWFEHNIIDSTDRYWEIYVIDGVDDKNVLQMNVRGNESAISATAENVQPGTYYVKIKPYYFNNVDYTFFIE